MPYGEIHCMRVRKREKENIKKLKVTKGTSQKISQHDDTEHKPKHKRIGTISVLVGLSLIGGALLVSPIGTAFADTVSDTIRSAQLEIEHDKELQELSEKAKATPVLTQDEVAEDEARAEQERKIEEYTQLLLSKQYAETANAVADDVVEKANEEDEQRERQQDGLFPSVDEYHRWWGADEELMKIAKPGALAMHPGPINRGVEIASEVADGHQSVILEQVRSGVATRMALLYLCGGGAR